MSDTGTTAAAGRARGGGGAKALLAWAIIVALLGAVAWLVSERNARTWYLVPDEGRLVVMRGMRLPVGRRAWTPDDPALAQAYAPVVAPPGTALPPAKEFEERSLLDQALYDLLAGWARAEVASADPARLERGLGYLARAERLPGLSSAQREDLAALRAESGYQEALRLVARAADALRDAADKLRRAAASRSPHAAEAGMLLGEVEPAAEAALGAVRASGAAARPQAPAAEAPPEGGGEPPGPPPPGPEAAPPDAAR
jgi:hypothetical protein